MVFAYKGVPKRKALGFGTGIKLFVRFYESNGIRGPKLAARLEICRKRTQSCTTKSSKFSSTHLEVKLKAIVTAEIDLWKTFHRAWRPASGEPTLVLPTIKRVAKPAKRTSVLNLITMLLIAARASITWARD